MAIDLSKVDRCPECGSSNIVHGKDNKSIVCKDCGGIYSELTPEQEKKFEETSDVI